MVDPKQETALAFLHEVNLFLKETTRFLRERPAEDEASHHRNQGAADSLAGLQGELAQLTEGVHGELLNWAKNHGFFRFDTMPGCVIS